MPTTPPLNTLRVFDSAARHLSFKLAAAELCVTQGAVTRQIQKLEEHLDMRLFVRGHRRVELTPAGSQYALVIRDALRRIDGATAALLSSRDSKVLKVRLPPTFGIRWLVPRLARFHAQHPELSVQISTPYETPNFDEEGVDIAVCYGEQPLPPDIACERLFGEVLVPIVSPAIAAGPNPLRAPADLANHVLLHSMMRPDDWRQWLAAAEARGVDPDGGLRLQNSGLVYQGMAEGLGVAIAQLAFVADDIATGRVVAPFAVQVRNQTGYFLIYPRDRLRRPAVRAFRDWILTEARQSFEAIEVMSQSAA